MGKIRILNEKVASQIAAGEVVERPASVLRELIDNSLDAGSDRIVIRVGTGGKRLIKVTDNGAGMTRDDLLMCVERHATSKITTISDLFSIETLGFRGEAIPSIASVSKMAITSRPVDQLVGHTLKINGGKLKSIDETGTPAGTTIEVRNLFFNTPVRRKFLRTVKTEADHLIDTLARIALPYNHVLFRLDADGDTVLNLPTAGDTLNRLTALFGKNTAASMLETRQKGEEIGFKVYLTPPEMSRSRGDRIFVYVNGRSIRDKLVTRAIIEGYSQRLMKGRYPQAVVFIELDPSQVDINVHPTKQEVRFQNTRRVYQSLVAFIEKTLSKKLYDPFQSESLDFDRAPEPKRYEIPLAEPAPLYRISSQGGEPTELVDLWQPSLLEKQINILGQLKNTYILCETAEGLLMVDQHAAHERIVYESLKKSHESAKIETQSLLIPHGLEFSQKESRIVLDKIGSLTGMGVELEHFGGNTFLLRSVPAILIDANWEDFLPELISVLEEEGDISQENALDRIFTTMACHGAIRAGKRLSKAEMTLLMNQLEKTALPTNCPHGRPVSKRVSYYEIEKMFKRVV